MATFTTNLNVFIDTLHFVMMFIAELMISNYASPT